jgi:hypothetical protein
MAWLVPIEAITQVKLIDSPGKKIELSITADLDAQNSILTSHSLKKVSKSQRDIEFNYSRMTTARDFLWHIKRIHHWWNFASPSGGKNNGK